MSENFGEKLLSCKLKGLYERVFEKIAIASLWICGIGAYFGYAALSGAWISTLVTHRWLTNWISTSSLVAGTLSLVALHFFAMFIGFMSIGDDNKIIATIGGGALIGSALLAMAMAVTLNVVYLSGLIAFIVAAIIIFCASGGFAHIFCKISSKSVFGISKAISEELCSIARGYYKVAELIGKGIYALRHVFGVIIYVAYIVASIYAINGAYLGIATNDFICMVLMFALIDIGIAVVGLVILHDSHEWGEVFIGTTATATAFVVGIPKLAIGILMYLMPRVLWVGIVMAICAAALYIYLLIVFVCWVQIELIREGKRRATVQAS